MRSSGFPDRQAPLNGMHAPCKDRGCAGQATSASIGHVIEHELRDRLLDG
jgi:hypothetical protein